MILAAAGAEEMDDGRPRTTEASAMRRRWQRHHTASAHITARWGPLAAESSSPVRAWRNSAPSM